MAELLAAHPRDALLDPISHLRGGPVAEGGADAGLPPHRRASPPWTHGGLPGTRRFDPANSGTSGLFVARILRRADACC